VHCHCVACPHRVLEVPHYHVAVLGDAHPIEQCHAVSPARFDASRIGSSQLPWRGRPCCPAEKSLSVPPPMSAAILNCSKPADT
jgi:hypothetical protein